MKLLTLVRHAKSSWDDASLADLDRPLGERGRKDLPLMAPFAATRLPPVDLLLCSPARRTRDTARAFAAALGYPASGMALDAGLYEASGASLLRLLQRQPASVGHLLLVGHMPGLGELSRMLCGGPDDKFPTCAVLHMGLKIHGWSELQAGCGELLWYRTPKRLG
ncbi:SixA phosphatase family protein [Zobellella iuensis]|uniref:Histidine phosphatase family protein n=1 Tax=Zobellella iuensis TaxID=2803811 RepID=A0ABS1QP00_9GAMM|nr:histidine phosphatase family protein [Zobellella iuensis]MBL1376586.1 histidine phosphatase family protein [Zobellella iuensis]